MTVSYSVRLLPPVARVKEWVCYPFRGFREMIIVENFLASHGLCDSSFKCSLLKCRWQSVNLLTFCFRESLFVSILVMISLQDGSYIKGGDVMTCPTGECDSSFVRK